MRAVYKYPFLIDDHVMLNLPRGAEILAVECQAGVPCLWALVDPDREPAPQRFRLFGTGHSIDDAEADRLIHVATFQQGPFVWHLFRDAIRDLS